jgi:hypothetical protein
LKKIVARSLVVIAFLFSAFGAFSQTDSCNLRISLLTCSPGEELYSTFGHTALRVIDHSNGMDLVFNYGTFDDSDPEFYTKFTKGLMLYALSAYPYSDFVREYQAEQRSVEEQVLQLTCTQKQALFNALRENAQEQNRFYYYYFHTDNCTTRARDMVQKSTGNAVTFKSILPAKTPSFRNLIHDYLNAGHQPWSKFGIDILLGANLDQPVTNETAMFLPDYLLKGFDSASIAGIPLVSEKQIVVPAPAKSAATGSWFTPFVLFTVLFILIALLSTLKPRWSGTFLRVFDISFFLLLGALGVLLVVLWAIRVDTVCRNNWNLLWALPTHLPAVFFIPGKKPWIKKYFTVVSILTLLTAVCWFFLPQQLNPAVAPILGILFIRAWRLGRKG